MRPNQPPKPTIPSIQGEESISGSAPKAELDDDMLDEAHKVGEQLNEDEEHPESIDIARDITQAEDYEKTH